MKNKIPFHFPENIKIIKDREKKVRLIFFSSINNDQTLPWIANVHKNGQGLEDLAISN